jgi:hypothetical protein
MLTTVIVSTDLQHHTQRLTYSLFSDMMTALQPINQMHTILDTEFDIDELKDIVNHGMSAGVSGFIYTRECVDKFNDNDDEIEEYLSDWYHDNMGENNYIGSISSNGTFSVGSIDELKTRMVWMYVELQANEILCANGINY